MKSQIDPFLSASKAAALWVTGPAQHNPAMVYLTGGGHLTHADVIQVVGHEPVVCHAPMERDEAAKTGLRTINFNRFPLKDRLQKAQGDRILADAMLYRSLFEEIGLTEGTVLLYGLTDVGKQHDLLLKVQQLLPAITFQGDWHDAVLLRAMATKDEDEINRIRRMGEIVVEVVSKTEHWLTHHPTQDETLIKSDGSTLTIADVKRQINLWLAEAGAENPEDTIFAIGRDAGVPHSSGNPADPIQLGRTIVFDIFPCEKGGGYFYDFTRTWCLGYAPPEVEKLYQDVRSVYQTIVSELEAGINASHFQQRTCDLFEALGHPTVRSDPATETGYVHSLGHGLGLHVHEKPSFTRPDDPSNELVPGLVFTIEPGLYYPDQGMGVRLEDTYYVTSEGTFEKMVDYPFQLVLPMQNRS